MSELHSLASRKIDLLRKKESTKGINEQISANEVLIASAMNKMLDTKPLEALEEKAVKEYIEKLKNEIEALTSENQKSQPLINVEAQINNNTIQDTIYSSKKFKHTRTLLKTALCAFLLFGSYLYLTDNAFSNLYKAHDDTLDACQKSSEQSNEINQNTSFIPCSTNNLTSSNPDGEAASFLFKRICIFTSYTTDNPTRLAMSESVAENQRAYAKKQGYEYLVYRENMAVELSPEEGQSKTWLPYWSKIAGINKILNNQETALKNAPEWIVWIDDDALITNENIKAQEIIDHYAPEGSEINFFVTEDSMSHVRKDIPLNSAVLFIKNNDWSREFFQAVWEMRTKPAPPDGKHTYGECPNQVCLHEQQAITDLMRGSNDWLKHIKVIRQRDRDDPVGGWGINTFHRWNHFDSRRCQRFNYDNDASGTRWKKGDFIGQCTGLVVELRAECIDQLMRPRMFDGTSITAILGEAQKLILKIDFFKSLHNDLVQLRQVFI